MIACLIPLFTLFSSCQFELADHTAKLIQQEEHKLQGNWVLVSVRWDGATAPLTGKKRGITIPTMVFGPDQVISFVGFDGAKDALAYRIDPLRTPRQLDLIPLEGKDRTTTCCIYSLDGEELKIAFSVWIAFGTEQEMLRDTIKMKSTRPKWIDGDRGDLVLVWTLKRVKK